MKTWRLLKKYMEQMTGRHVAILGAVLVILGWNIPGNPRIVFGIRCSVAQS